MTEDELSAFQDAVSDAGERVSEFLAAQTDESVDDIEAAVEELPMPDPLDDRPVEE